MRYLAQLVGFVTLACSSAIRAEEPAPLKPTQVIPLPGVSGRIDHMAVDLKAGRLFVAALGNNTIEVIDLAQGKRVRSVAGLKEPQGIAFLPELSRLAVACGGDGTCRFYDTRTMAPAGSTKLTEDADNVRYDATAKRVYVAYGSGAIATLDAQTGMKLADVAVRGHPESFQLESKGTRAFVNVPTAQQVAVIDRAKNEVIATWPMRTAEANFPMALDEANHRLFIGCRKPPMVVVLDTASGKVVTDFACAGDTDDLFYDAASKRVYVACGEGYINVIGQTDPDRYTQIAKITTAPGARTALFVSATKRLYLAVPHRTGQDAEVRVYEAR